MNNNDDDDNNNDDGDGDSYDCDDGDDERKFQRSKLDALRSISDKSTVLALALSQKYEINGFLKTWQRPTYPSAPRSIKLPAQQ